LKYSNFFRILNLSSQTRSQE